mmetsp:Transcript_21604/g.59377  ORF Transcript_21604/g.59377 Transcript_21604/m.59377 type:complete len:256 (+) Transcript_21604:499-1266(+)|eukprot:scaffold75031_cov33-Tisochrysis_lutea.AAC.2
MLVQPQSSCDGAQLLGCKRQSNSIQPESDPALAVVLWLKTEIETLKITSACRAALSSRNSAGRTTPAPNSLIGSHHGLGYREQPAQVRQHPVSQKYEHGYAEDGGTLGNVAAPHSSSSLTSGSAAVGPVDSSNASRLSCRSPASSRAPHELRRFTLYGGNRSGTGLFCIPRNVILGGPYRLMCCPTAILPKEVASVSTELAHGLIEGTRVCARRIPRAREVGMPEDRSSAPFRTPLSEDIRSAPRRESSRTLKLS